MSTSVANVVSHFPDAENGFTTTLASTISSGATTVPLNSVAGYTNGMPAVFVVDPADLTKKQTFTGIVDTAGVQVTSVVWTAGTNQQHTGGATVVDYATATHMAMITKGILVHADQDGTLRAGAVDNAAVLANDVVTSAKILDNNVTHTELALGVSVQTVYTVSSAVATGTTVIPDDDTVPQNTEGTEFMTVSITPKSATNILVIRANVLLSTSAVNNYIGAIFQDTTVSALAAGEQRDAGGGTPGMFTLEYVMVAGTASATTFKFRAGPDAAGTLTFNGTLGARIFGTASKSSFTVTEFKAA